MLLHSGTIVMFGGDSRLRMHGISRIIPISTGCGNTGTTGCGNGGTNSNTNTDSNTNSGCDGGNGINECVSVDNSISNQCGYTDIYNKYRSCGYGTSTSGTSGSNSNSSSNNRVQSQILHSGLQGLYCPHHTIVSGSSIGSGSSPVSNSDNDGNTATSTTNNSTSTSTDTKSNNDNITTTTTTSTTTPPLCPYCQHPILTPIEQERLLSYLYMTRVNINIRQMFDDI